MGLPGRSGGWAGSGQTLAWGGAGLGIAAGVGVGTRGMRVLRSIGFFGELGEGLTSMLCQITPPPLHSLIHSTEAY